MTKQEIFDTVAKHLLTQMERSESRKGCLYRGPNGLKCAVGVLIKDEFYSEELEYATADVSEVMAALEKSGVFYDEIMIDLQILHDEFYPVVWKASLNKVAERNNLSPAVLESF